MLEVYCWCEGFCFVIVESKFSDDTITKNKLASWNNHVYGMFMECQKQYFTESLYGC